ncbi:glycosyltransferase family 2 protein [Acidiferrobacter sp.]|uniref:glycosyltransferase family 2 protein n=1 Tax=Acidiferrobacter sp. TaxID=1872107 RepID=UPI00260600B3|nr:glycosyltransferase family 2 protein [Acidiferrobacter sp.]
MPTASTTHLVLIPSFNPGRAVYETVAEALRSWSPVWVVVDGSTDGTAEGLVTMARHNPDLTVIVEPRNRGKGAAVLSGLARARAHGYTHALCMDSDGQHPAALIPAFMQASVAHPGAMILGVPVFPANAPRARVYGRRISNLFTNIETLGRHIGDSLFGFRVYPVEPLLRIMNAHRSMRRFDFDPEAAVRLFWEGAAVYNIEAPVCYPRKAEGGVSHFHYVRDNLLLIGMHIRLLLGLLIRIPRLLGGARRT